MLHRTHTRAVFARRSEGFTLAELLVVVAIVLVLVGVAVPVFTGALGTSEEATCAANRRALKVIVSTAYSTTSPSPSQSELEALLQTSAASLKDSTGGQDLCPAGGTYTLAGTAASGSIVVKCSVHGLSFSEEFYFDVLGIFTEDELKNGTDLYHTSTAQNGGGDKGARITYAEKHNITNWPEATGKDNKGNDKTYYIQFKSCNKKATGMFLYAGTNPDPRSDSNAWNAKYVCDSLGLVEGGEPGQWYMLSSETSLGSYNSEESLKALLSGSDVKAVELENGQFK